MIHEWPLPTAAAPTKGAAGSSWLAHDSRAYTLAITPDGERVISTGQDGMLHVWDPASDGRRQLLDDPQLSGDGGDFAVIPGTSTLAVTGWGQLRTWDPETSELSPPAPLEANSWDRLATSPDGKTIAVANSDNEEHGREGVIAIVDRDDWSVRQRIRHGGVAPCWSLDYSPDGSLLGAIIWPKGKPDVLWLFDAASGQRLPGFAVPHCNCFAFSPVTGLMAASRENHVLVYNVDRLEIVCDLHGHYDTVDDVAFSHDGTLLATSGSRDVILWDARDGREIRRLTGFTTSHNFLAFAADDRSLVTGGEDGVIRVWHVATGEHMFDLGTLPHPVDKIGLSQDGRRFLCLSHQNQIVVFNTSAAAAKPTANDIPSPDTATSQRR